MYTDTECSNGSDTVILPTEPSPTSRGTSRTECSNGSGTDISDTKSAALPTPECSNGYGMATSSIDLSPPSRDTSRTECSNGSRTDISSMGPKSFLGAAIGSKTTVLCCLLVRITEGSPSSSTAEECTSTTK